MKDIRNAMILMLLGMVACLLYFFKKQQMILDILAQSHRELEEMMREGGA